jgi:hypothetical protein
LKSCAARELTSPGSFDSSANACRCGVEQFLHSFLEIF